jgi:hypothetical protein
MPQALNSFRCTGSWSPCCLRTLRQAYVCSAHLGWSRYRCTAMTTRSKGKCQVSSSPIAAGAVLAVMYMLT